MSRYLCALSSLLLSALLVCSCQPVMPEQGNTSSALTTESSDKVLLLLREYAYPYDPQPLFTNEAFMMKDMLEEAGYNVVIASASGRTFAYEDKDLVPDLKLSEVNIADYAGFIIPCLAMGTPTVKPEEVAFAKQVVADGKPVAAQGKGIHILAEAGALVGKRFSYNLDPSSDPIFDGAIYEGNGVVRDGNICTSYFCPYYGSRDQTAELVQTLVTLLQQ